MSTLQVTTITTVNNTTPLIIQSGNTGGGQIVLQAGNSDIQLNGTMRFTANITGDGSGLTIPAANVANAAYTSSNAGYVVANSAFGKANVALTGVVPVANGGTGLSSLSAYQILYPTSSSAIGSSSLLKFDGTYFFAGGLRLNGTDADINQIWQSNYNTYLGITANGGPILFGQTGSEKMRLTAAGRLGIGQSNPGALLHVGISGNSYSYIGDNYIYDDGQCHITASNSKSMFLQSQSAQVYLNQEYNGNVLLAGGGGRVGIGYYTSGGVISPGAVLEVAGSASYNPLIVSGRGNPTSYFTSSTAVTNGNTDVTIQTYNGLSSGPYWSNLNFNTSGTVFKAYNVESARFDGSGNFGIGTSSPWTYGKFSVVTGSNYFCVASSIYNSVEFGPRTANDGYCSVLYNYGTFGAGNFWKFDASSGGFNVLQAVSGTQTTKLNVSSSGTLSPSGCLAPTGAPGTYAIDITTGSSAVTVANGGTVGFPSASGMLVVNNWSNGGVTIYICGGGGVTVIGTVQPQVGTLAYTSGNAGYTWTNNYGASGTFGFFFVRTRNTA
jgi:hypothetical protein